MWPLVFYDSPNGKDFLRAKGLPVSGKKADLIQRINEYVSGSWVIII